MNDENSVSNDDEQNLMWLYDAHVSAFHSYLDFIWYEYLKNIYVWSLQWKFKIRCMLSFYIWQILHILKDCLVLLSCSDLFWFNACIYTFGDRQYIGIDDSNIS